MNETTFKYKQKCLNLTNKKMAESLGFSVKHVEQMRSGSKSIALHTVLLIDALCTIQELRNGTRT